MPALDIDVLFSDLDQDAIEMVKSGGLPFLFAVVSWGCAATEWLARTLNSHPDIFCLHHDHLVWNRVGGAPPLDGWKYLRVIGASGWGYRACGDVHGVSLNSIPDLRSKLGDHFNCAILVREPLPRLRSQIALFESSARKDTWNVDYVQTFIDRGVCLPQDNLENRLFLHGVNMLNNIVQEEQVAPMWRSEDLTTNAPMLVRFVAELTRGRVEANPDWAQRAVSRPPSNRHRGPTAAAHEFADWQIEAINRIVNLHAWRIYERIGYRTPDFVAMAPIA